MEVLFNYMEKGYTENTIHTTRTENKTINETTNWTKTPSPLNLFGEPCHR